MIDVSLIIGIGMTAQFALSVVFALLWRHADRTLRRARDAGEKAERDRDYCWTAIIDSLKIWLRQDSKAPADAAAAAIRYAGMLLSIGADAPCGLVAHDDRVEMKWENDLHRHAISFYPDGRTVYQFEVVERNERDAP